VGVGWSGGGLAEVLPQLAQRSLSGDEAWPVHGFWWIPTRASEGGGVTQDLQIGTPFGKNLNQVDSRGANPLMVKFAPAARHGENLPAVARLKDRSAL
jgi:hypothetical protein